MARRTSRAYDDGWRAINRLIRRGGSWSGHERDVFYANLGRMNFAEISGLLGLDFIEDGRAFAAIDLDGDGDQDLITKNRNAPQVRLMRNETPLAYSSIVFNLRGVQSNREAVGAVVTVETPPGMQKKQVTLGAGYLSQYSHRLHFGLKDYSGPVRARIEWPSGAVQEFASLPANHLVRIEEGNNQYAAEPLRARTAEPPCTTPPPIERAARPPRSGWLLERIEPPEAELAGLDGKKLSTKNLRGHPLLLNFWATWCAPCQAEMKQWAAEYENLRKAGVELLAISVDEPKDRTKVEAFVRQYQLGFPVLLADEKTVLSNSLLLAGLFEANGELQIPTTFLLDAEGRVARVYRGVTSTEEIRQDLKELEMPATEALGRGLPYGGRYVITPPRRDFFRLANLYFESGFLEEAAAYLREGLAQQPQNAIGWMNLGVIEGQQGDTRAALRSLEQALAVDPKLAEAQFNLGIAYLQLHRNEPAEQAFARAAELDPEDPQKQMQLGMIYLQNGKDEAAIAALERYAALEPQDAQGWTDLGILYSRQGDWPRATRSLESALHAQPNFAPALRSLGVVYLYQEKTSEAVQALERAAALSPNDPDTYFALAQACERAGRPGDARRALEKVLELQPDNQSAREALRRLDAGPRD